MEDEKTANNIKEILKIELEKRFGFCGVMESEKFIMLNSGKGNLIIKITWE